MEAIDIIGDPEIIAEAVSLAQAHGLDVSEPMSTESISDALDGPFGAEEIRQLCETITVIISTGTAIITFLTALKKLLKRAEDPRGPKRQVSVKKTKTQADIGTLDAETDLSSLEI